MKPTRLAIAIVVLTLVCCGAGRAQNPDTAAIIRLNTKAWEIKSNEPDSSKLLAEQAITAANKIGYRRGLSFSYNVLGNYFKQKALYDSAALYYQKSLVIRQELHDTLGMARSYRNLMSIDKNLGNYKRAIKTGLLAIQLLAPGLADAEAAKENAWLHVNIAPIYSKMGDYNSAVRYATAGKTYYRQLQDENGMGAAAINLGGIYEDQKQYEKALKEYRSAIETYSESGNKKELAKAYSNTGNIYYYMNDLPGALKEIRKALAIRVEGGFDNDIPGSLHNLGAVYEDMGRVDSALLYYKRSLALSDESGNVEGQIEVSLSLGSLLAEQKQFREALRNLLRALTLGEQSSALPDKMLLFKEIANAYRGAGMSDSAFFYNDKYSILNDSLAQIARSSILLGGDLKEKEYALDLSEEANKRQTAIIIGISVALALLLIIFLMYYLASQSKKRELQLRQVIKEKELVALDAMLEGQEEERKRLATELHDTIGSILAATKYAFKAMEKSMEKMLTESKTQYVKIDTMLDEAMESVRRISHDMMEGKLTEKGLEGALTELCETFEKSGKIKFKVEMYGFDRRMEYKIESNLYRIIQELVTNIIKHSQARNVSLQLLKSKQNINLVVEDDGKGFDPDDPALKRGIGISNVDTRVKKLAGTWNIDSGKGKGTTVVIDIPLNEEPLK